MRAYKILLIDDDEEEYIIFKDYLSDLKAKHSLVWVDTYEEGISCIRNKTFDICFVDFNLGAKTGLDLYREIKSDDFIPPVILFTNQGSRTLDLMALESGISDYIVKSMLSADVIDRSIRYAISRSNLLNNIQLERYRYNSLFNNTMDPIALCRSDFKIYETNLAFKNILGDEYDSIESLLFEEFISELLHNKDSTKKAIYDEGFKNHYFQVITGERLNHFLVSAVKTSFDKEVPDGFQVIFHDVGHIIEAESARSLREKRDFTEKIAKLIAHEIRNPLSNINLAASELLDDESFASYDDGNSMVFLEIIKRNALRINSLIDQLLDSSSPADLNFQHIKVADILSSVISLCQDRINLIDVELLVEATKEELYMNADLSKLSLALSNIVTNAIEAMNEVNPAILKIKYFQQDNFIVFQIGDTGKGMDQEEAKRIFEPFYTKKRGGKGLGMTLSQNIINEHGGEIVVDSQLGIGTVVSVQIKTPRHA